MTTEMLNGFPSLAYCLAGPALNKWGTKVPQNKLILNVEKALNNAQLMLSGTGWSEFEHDARMLAKQHQVKNIAALDHWVNYAERFTKNNECCLPDEIYVYDEYAYAIAKQTFSHLPVTQKHNDYLNQTLKIIQQSPLNIHSEILYVLEPIPDSWGDDKVIIEEFQALEYFKAYLTTTFSHQYTKIRMRLHPSETRDKYQDWINTNAHLSIVFDDCPDIETSIANSKWIFGCESSGLVVAINSGKEVFSTIPHWGPRARLPHKHLKHLRDLF